jgi:hypothetical protein
MSDQAWKRIAMLIVFAIALGLLVVTAGRVSDPSTGQTVAGVGFALVAIVALHAAFRA